VGASQLGLGKTLDVNKFNEYTGARKGERPMMKLLALLGGVIIFWTILGAVTASEGGFVCTFVPPA